MDTLSRTDIARQLMAESIAEGREANQLADWIWRDILAVRSAMLSRPDSAVLEKLQAVVNRLRRGEPIQYIAGHAYFFGNSFEVTPATLIPRPETEDLVVWALEEIRRMPPGTLRLVDVGTGSGCIAITLAMKLGTRAEVLALDISRDALAVATRNAKRLEANVEFLQVDFLEAGLNGIGLTDLIISNPPYVDPNLAGPDVMAALQFEPREALVAPGPDPDIFYRQLSRAARSGLRPETGCIILEINELRWESIADIFHREGWRDVDIRQDLSGRPRMLRAARPA